MATKRPDTKVRAIAALRAMHKGGYHANAEFGVRINGRITTRQADRDAARARLDEIKAQNGGKLPQPATPEVASLRNVCLTFRVAVGHINGVGGLSFFVIDGQGDTIADAVDAARAARERDHQRYLDAKK